MARGDRAPTEIVWQPNASLGFGVYFVRAKIGGNNKGLKPLVTKRIVYLK